MGRDALSQSHSGPLKACGGCVELSELRHSVFNVATRVDNTEEQVSALDATVTEQGRQLAVLTERVLLSVDGLRREFSAAVTASGLEHRGKDPRESTPTGRLPEIKAGIVSLRGPVWLVLSVVLVLALVLGGIAGVAYVAAQWGPPTRAASK